MDLAYSYDHIINTDDRAVTPTPPNAPTTSEATTTTEDPTTPKPTQSQPARQNLQTEFQETFKVFSSSPWGAKLGGLWGNVRKQGESYYEEAVREAEAAKIDALKGLNDIREGIVGRVRSLSVNEKDALDEAKEAQEKDQQQQPQQEPIPGEEPVPAHHQASTSTFKDTDLQENETFIERFKAEAAKRLKEVQKAEDAADEALLRFGTNIRNFLRDAVAVTAPEDSSQPGEVLFESKDSSGKRTIHTSRMDAQLHLIHTSTSRFTHDPSDSGEQWDQFQKTFDVEDKTDAIAKDLEKYPELRRTMEGLVPEKVEYKDFWARYYFLRQALEAQEEKRRELLKATTANDAEEVAWDEDSDSEEEEESSNKASTPQTQTASTAPKLLVAQNTNDSTSTVNNQSQTAGPASASASAASAAGGGGLKKPGEGRRSHDEKSVADSEASYDIVSGAPSRAASSPKEKKAEESDDDWE